MNTDGTIAEDVRLGRPDASAAEALEAHEGLVRRGRRYAGSWRLPRPRRPTSV